MEGFARSLTAAPVPAHVALLTTTSVMPRTAVAQTLAASGGNVVSSGAAPVRSPPESGQRASSVYAVIDSEP